jgi:menaquinone-dependent protoporphyrinogen oxidase
MPGEHVAILFESVEGHTASVAERLQALLRARGLRVSLGPCSQAGPEALAADGLIVGSSIHAGRHNRKALRFAREHLGLLAARPSAQFLVCLTARSTEPAHQAVVAGYLADFTARSGWRPAIQQAFAGALLYTRYGLLKRKLMQSILEKKGGETDASRDHVYTDWQAVESFATAFAGLLSP